MLRALYRKSKQEKVFRFYSLYDKICRTDVLWEAWRQVKANQGAPGVDGKAIEEVIAQGEAKVMGKLQKRLCEQSYPFSPVRQVEIPKPKGGTGISTVEDRIVQTAMKRVIEPIFEADFQECAYGYRPRRSAPIDPETFIKQVKPMVLGWINHFKHTNASRVFQRLQRFINIRSQRYLTHRRKGRGFGWNRYPDSKLYAMGIPYIAGGMIEYSGTLAHGLLKTVGPPYSGKLNVRWDKKGMINP